jgi:hypothetical protein
VNRHDRRAAAASIPDAMNVALARFLNDVRAALPAGTDPALAATLALRAVVGSLAFAGADDASIRAVVDEALADVAKHHAAERERRIVVPGQG